MTPFVGSAGNALNRVILSAVGTVIWGITSVGLGAARSFAQVMTPSVGSCPPLHTSGAQPKPSTCWRGIMQHPVDADKTYKHAEPMKRAQAIQSGGVLLTFGKLQGAVLT